MSPRLIDRLLGSGRRESPTDAISTRYDPALDSVSAVTDTDAVADLDHPHLSDPLGTEAGTVRAQARAYRDRGASASGFVAAHGIAVEAAVTAAFEELRERGGADAALDEVEAELSVTLDGLVESAATGVSAFGRQVAADGGAAANADVDSATDIEIEGTAVPAEPSLYESTEIPLDSEALLDSLGTAVFVVDADGELVIWNEGVERLTGVAREDAAEKEMLSQAFYHDGRRAQTLADKVLDAPESADEEYGVPRVEEYDYTLYRDRSTMTDARNEMRHLSFTAAPLYDDDGEFAGVIEMLHDRTEDERRNERTSELVAEVQSTVEAIQRGEFEERAAFDDRGYVATELVSVVDSINDLADRFEVLETRVSSAVSDLHDEAETVADSSVEINRSADDQRETMHQLSAEISNLSATVEEVASSATQVDATSSEAEALADEGQTAAEEAVSLLDDVEDSAEEVATDVDALSGRIDEIDDIATVINDIADQTNILALNASIEAARAGEAGEGFAVVADEVKTLAEESQQHASDIEGLIDGIQSDTDETVESLSATTERIDEVIDQVEAAMRRLMEIVDAVSGVSDGIQEVADATDEQAASTEEVASMVDEAADAADDIADDIQQIAAANEEQMERADRITDHFRQQD